ncbi:hypothetical protein niasHT_031635 [Heterodera trifolii]|uniref:MULE transposase domain-containing protein n=1 Tax=Heterodera trifolii TaxID=157864 RepID=A0ABD2J4D6_9BILA
MGGNGHAFASTDDSIVVEERAVVREAEMRAAATDDSDASATISDEENSEPVKFERGTTQKGALCLWHKGYKFVRNRFKWFSCCQQTCRATARLDDEQIMTGLLGPDEHNHCAVCAQVLLPGKNSRFYREALSAISNAVASAPARIISDFERSMMRAAREVFPEALQSGCNFHWAQCLFRKAKSLGIFNLFNGNDEEAEEERKNVHRISVLTLALLPPMHVRRAFALTAERAPLGMQAWLSYVAKTYIGLTQAEQRLGIVAFEPQHISFLSRSSNTMRSRLLTLSMESTDFSTLSGDHSYVNLPITRPPKYNVDFWNVNDRAQAALERTNNGMESAHGQFARDLNHHPSLGAFLAAFIKDIDKQCDIAQAIRLRKIRSRQPKYVIKEQ